MASPGVLSSFEFNAMYVRALQQGDPSTEEHFVNHFSPILLKKLRRKLRSMDQARDLRQETFLRVLALLRSEQTVRQPERFEIFVLGVCNNVLRETYRQQRRLVQMEPEFDLPADAPSPDERVITSETGSYVQRLLCSLDPNVRAILEAAFLEEQDRGEICLRFGISRDHLRLLIFRAKKMFGNCAQQEMTGKSRTRVRRKSGRRVFAVINPQVAMPSNTEHCSAPIFMPALAANEALAEQCCA